MRYHRILGNSIEKQRTDGLDDFDVRFLVPSRQCCRLIRLDPGLEDSAQRVAMVAHVQPVATLPISVNGQRFSRSSVQYNERNKLLRKLQWPVIVGAIGGQGRQAIGVAVSAHQVVCGRFRSGVRTVRSVGRGLGESRILSGQRSVALHSVQTCRNRKRAFDRSLAGWTSTRVTPRAS